MSLIRLNRYHQQYSIRNHKTVFIPLKIGMSLGIQDELAENTEFESRPMGIIPIEKLFHFYSFDNTTPPTLC